MKTMKTILTALVAAALVAVASPAASQTLSVKSAESSISAVGAKVTGDHTLNFTNFTGAAKLDKGQVVGLEFTVQVADFTTDLGDSEWGLKFSGHLKSPDFFDVANFPTATFKSTKIEVKESKWGTHEVTGKLTLRGKEKTILFPATLKLDGGKLSGKTEFTINRKDFNMIYEGKADDLIKDAVLLKINLNLAP